LRGTESNQVYIISHLNELEHLARSSVFSYTHTAPFEVESFVQGQHLHVNGLFQGGKILCSWSSVYPSPPVALHQGQYAASYLLGEDNPLNGHLKDYVENVLKSLPTPDGMAFHLEVFVNSQNEIILCEIASRVGGKGVNLGWKKSFGI